MEMNKNDKAFVERLEAMTLEQARRELASGKFGRPGSPNHDFASQWLTVKEGEEQDKRGAVAKSQATQIHDRLVELKRPHWSLTPSFIVLLLTMFFAAIAAWPVIREWFQPSPSVDTGSTFQLPQSHLEPKK
jgi:hypothetical protein